MEDYSSWFQVKWLKFGVESHRFTHCIASHLLFSIFFALFLSRDGEVGVVAQSGRDESPSSFAAVAVVLPLALSLSLSLHDDKRGKVGKILRCIPMYLARCILKDFRWWKLKVQDAKLDKSKRNIMKKPEIPELKTIEV